MTASRSLVAITAGLLGLAGTAAADPPRRLAVYADQTQELDPAPAALVSNKLFLNRCLNGCMFTQSTGQTSSSRLNQTWLGGDGDTGAPGSGTPGTVYTIPACGAAGRPLTEMTCDDAMWQEIVDCVVDVYAPYDVIVTDVDPGTAIPHHEAVAAG